MHTGATACWESSPIISKMAPSVACKQECGHTHCRCVSCAGHSSQAADLAVHLPAADLRGTGTLQEQDRPLPGLQECRLAGSLLCERLSWMYSDSDEFMFITAEPEIGPETHRRSSSMRVSGTSHKNTVRERSSDDCIIGTHLGMGMTHSPVSDLVLD